MTARLEDLLPSTRDWARELGVSEEAVELYRTSEVIDLHVDSFIWWRLFRYDLHRRHGLGPLGGRFFSQVDVPRALEAGLKGAIWVITTNPFWPARVRSAVFARNLRAIKGLLVQDPRIVLVRTAAEYRAARAAGKHGAFLGIQGGNALSSLDDFDLIPDGDILRITLVHLTSSRIGRTSAPSPSFLGPADLTRYGWDYVRRMNERKILVDLAHIGRRAFFEAVAAHDPSLPLSVTHTGVDAVHPHWRNVTDEQLRAVADSGGTVGVMFQCDFLGHGEVTAETVVDHIEHIVDTVGEDHASIGSDYDGAIIPPEDLSTPYGMPRLVHSMLRRGFSPSRVQKILGGNFLRVVEALRG
jgi:membrane dipeptidase